MGYQFRIGDLAYHNGYPGWVWKLVEAHNNPSVGWWELVFVSEGAIWPFHFRRPKIGDGCELGYDPLAPVTEMEVLAMAAS